MALALSPSGDTPAWPQDAVEVGRIVDAWGVKGWFKVQPFAADPQALFSSRRWFLRAPAHRAAPGADASQRPGPVPPSLKITQARRHADGVVAQAQEVEDRTSAEALRGASIFVSRTSFPSAGVDEFYWVDLIGLSVVNRQGDLLGKVIGLIDTGPGSVLRIAPADASIPDEASERLIPFVAAYIDRVDLPGRKITVDWGLDY